MRLLLDACMSIRLTATLVASGHDAIHVESVLPRAADDGAIFALAHNERRVVITQDTDFATLFHLCQRRASVVLLRLNDGRPDRQLPRLLSALAQCQADLERGAIIVVEETTVRVRRTADDAE